MDKHLIFYLMFFPTFIFFIGGMGLHLNLWLEGTFPGAEKATKNEKMRILLRRTWKGFWLRPGWHLRVLIQDVIFHQKLFRQSFYRWLAHTTLVIGFICTFVVDMTKGFTTFYLLELSRSIPFFSFAHEFETGSLRPLIDFFLEFFSFLILVGCFMALIRRLFLKVDPLRTEEEDILTLLFILFLELSGFFIEGYRIAHPQVSQARVYMANLTPASANDWISFGGYFLSLFLKSVKINADFLWYFHVIPCLVWFIYIPHSKLLHIFTSSMTVFMNRSEEGAHPVAGEK
jgi:hypothetical protein